MNREGTSLDSKHQDSSKGLKGSELPVLKMVEVYPNVEEGAAIIQKPNPMLRKETHPPPLPTPPNSAAPPPLPLLRGRAQPGRANEEAVVDEMRIQTM